MKIRKGIFLFIIIFLLTSCKEPPHEHIFGEKYKYDETQHWINCEVEDCKEKINAEYHDYVFSYSKLVGNTYKKTATCTVCGSIYVDDFSIDNVIDEKDEWYILFNSFKLTNYSLNVYYEDGDSSECNSAFINEFGVKIVNDSIIETYSIKQNDDVFYTYNYYEDEDKWILSEDTSDSIYNNIVQETTMQFLFADAFEKFSYDKSTGIYKSNEPLTAVLCYDSEESEEIILNNVEILIVDGEISSIKADYFLENEEVSNSRFEYFDIGTTVVQVPDEILNKAEHKHLFDDQYQYENDKHWIKCSIKGCNEIISKDYHNFTISDTKIVDNLVTIEKRCLVCEYVETEQYYSNNIIESNEEWNSIFDSFKLTNYTMNVHIDYSDSKDCNTCFITEDGVKVIYNNVTEMYSIKQEDNTYYNYLYDEYEDKWYLSDDTSSNRYDGMIEESTLHFMLTDSFDKFKYDEETGSYKCSSKITAWYYFDGEKQEIVLCNVEIIIIDGKVYSILSDYLLTGETVPTCRLEYFDIEETVVTVPDEIIENAVHEHDFVNHYTYDDDEHWVECSIKGCIERIKYDSHVYTISASKLIDNLYIITKTCLSCGYEIQEEYHSDNIINSNEEWNEIFNSFKLTNYTMNIHNKYGQTLQCNTCLVTEEGIQVAFDFVTQSYSVKQDDNSFNNYLYSEYENTWYLTTDTSGDAYNTMVNDSALHFQLVDTFSKFIYDESTGVYKCNSPIIAVLNSDGNNQELTLSNVEIIIIDGQVYSIKANYSLFGEIATTTFEYFDIEETVVTVPDRIIKNAILYK